MKSYQLILAVAGGIILADVIELALKLGYFLLFVR